MVQCIYVLKWDLQVINVEYDCVEDNVNHLVYMVYTVFNGCDAVFQELRILYL